jgi:DNA primase
VTTEKANFEAVKAVVFCDRLAEEEVVLRPSGGHLRGQCPLPDHDGDSPSFYCLADERGAYTKWHCHRCNKNGDVIDLYNEMYGPFGNPWLAMTDLADRFRIKLWREDDFLDPWQLEVRRQERRAEAAFTRAVMEEIFERDVMPQIKAIEDPEKRARLLATALREAGLA